MSDVTLGLPCPACKEAVFDGWPVVRCSRCETVHHQTCWEQRGGCKGRERCKGKPVPTLVLRVPIPIDEKALGVAAGEAAARAVAAHLEPLLQRLAADSATASQITTAARELTGRIAAMDATLHSLVSHESRELRTAVERALEAQAARFEELGEAVGASRSGDTEFVAAVATRVGEELSARIGETLEQVRAEIETVRASLGADVRRLQDAVDACHLAVEVARRPLPWETGGAGPLREELTS